MPVYDAVCQRVGCQAMLMDGLVQHEAHMNPFSNRLVPHDIC
jgi:hypothetical protein